MCGIVGLFLKDKTLEPQLGAMLTDMLITMTDRGPDSAGIAIYGEPQKGMAKLTLQSSKPLEDFNGLQGSIEKAVGSKSRLRLRAHILLLNYHCHSSTMHVKQLVLFLQPLKS